MEKLTSAETIVMKTIWDAEEELSLSDIVERANANYDKSWKPQTVSTYLAKIVQKGFISMRRSGRRILYDVLIKEEDYRKVQTQQFIEFWNQGSVRKFLETFYKDRTVTKEEIEDLKELINEL